MKFTDQCDNFISIMAPHQKEKTGGRLLIKANRLLKEIKSLLRKPATKENIEELEALAEEL